MICNWGKNRIFTLEYFQKHETLGTFPPNSQIKNQLIAHAVFLQFFNWRKHKLLKPGICKLRITGLSNIDKPLLQGV